MNDSSEQQTDDSTAPVDAVAMPDFASMSIDDAIAYCHANKSQYVADSGDYDDGIRQFCCLIAILESGTITPSELPQYGMCYPAA